LSVRTSAHLLPLTVGDGDERTRGAAADARPAASARIVAAIAMDSTSARARFIVGCKKRLDQPFGCWKPTAKLAIRRLESGHCGCVIAGTFNLDTAPNVDGRFLGDYQGLSSLDTVFEPFFVQTNSGNLTNRTDVFSEPAVSLSAMYAQLVRTMSMTAQATPTVKITDELRKRVSANIDRTMEPREVQWRNLIRQRQGLPPLQPLPEAKPEAL